MRSPPLPNTNHTNRSRAPTARPACCSYASETYVDRLRRRPSSGPSRSAPARPTCLTLTRAARVRAHCCCCYAARFLFRWGERVTPQHVKTEEESSPPNPFLCQPAHAHAKRATRKKNNQGGGASGWYRPGGFSYHEGDAADPRMTAAAAKRGVKLTSRSRPLAPGDFARFQHIIAMDDNNVRAIEVSLDDAREIYGRGVEGRNPV